MNTKSGHRPTDDEIEAEVLATRGDESAWEALPFVSPSRSPRPEWMKRSRHLELAAKFHVLSFLHLLGLEANLALSHPNNVDIAVLREAGEALTVEVKTLSERREWLVDQFAAKPHHFVIFVVFDEMVPRPSFASNLYIAASEALHSFVYKNKLRSLSLDVLAKELNAENAWKELVAASRPDSG